MMTIRAFLEQETRAGPNERAGPARSLQEAWALGCHVLGWPLARLLAVRTDEPLPYEQETRWRELLIRRDRGEPQAYLLGHTEFWSLSLQVTPSVLVPRPETEILVEQALRDHKAPAHRYMDVGTGSGAIALALKKERPHAQVVASDKSLAALDVARANSRALGLPISFFAGSLLEAVGRAHFDVIVSNPPYIESADPCLDGDGLRFEPRTALDGGKDGLSVIAALIATAPKALAPGGRLLIEHGAQQGPATTELLRRAGFQEVCTHADYAGHLRVSEGVLYG